MPIPKHLRKEFGDKDFAHAYVDELLNVAIATQLKVLRQQRKLTQEQLATAAKMKQERISLLENVNYSSWSINTLKAIAEALDVTLSVSFEEFGTQLRTLDSINRKALERRSREEELDADINGSATPRTPTAGIEYVGDLPEHELWSVDEYSQANMSVQAGETTANTFAILSPSG